MDEDFVDPNEYYADSENRTTGNHSSGGRNSDDQLYRSVGYVALMIGITIFAYFNWAPDRDQASPIEQDQSSVEIPPQSNSRAEFTKPTIASKKMQEITGLSVGALEERDWAKEEAVAANRSAVADLKAKLDKISGLRNSYSENLVGLKTSTEALRTSEEGAKIASDLKFVQQYIALQEKISELREPSTVTDDFVKDMKALLQRIEDSNDTSYAPQQFVVDRATGFIESLEKQTSELKRLEKAVNGLIAETNDLPAGELLETAIKSESSKTDIKLAEALVEAREAAMSAKRIELAQAEKEKVRALADLEKAKITASTDLARRQRNDVLASAAKQKLEQEFNRDLNDINTYLLPFISEGRNLRGNKSGTGPASFSAIKAKGALENTAEGLASLSKAARNGRPLGGFPINILSHMITNNSTVGNVYNTAKYRGIEAYLEKAQSLLVKYGALLVEKGMLAD